MTGNSSDTATVAKPPLSITAAKKGTVPLLFALLLAAACDQGGDLFQQARDLAVAGKSRDALASAARAADELPQGDPRRVKALALAGDLAYLYVGDLKAAVRHYRRLCDEAPGTEEAFVARGRLGDLYRERLDDLPAAVEQYQALVAAFPGRREIDGYRLQIARSYLALRDYEQARADARGLVESAPDGELADDAFYLYATAFQTEGRRGEALMAWNMFVNRFASSPLAPQAWVEKGALHADQGDDNAALEAWAQARAAHRDPRMVNELMERAKKRLSRKGLAAEASLGR